MPSEGIMFSCFDRGNIFEEVALCSISREWKVEDVYNLPPCLVVPSDMDARLLPLVFCRSVDALQFEAAP